MFYRCMVLFILVMFGIQTLAMAHPGEKTLPQKRRATAELSQEDLSASLKRQRTHDSEDIDLIDLYYECGKFWSRNHKSDYEKLKDLSKAGNNKASLALLQFKNIPIAFEYSMHCNLMSLNQFIHSNPEDDYEKYYQAMLYECGFCSVVNYEKARQIYQALADEGFAPAHYRLSKFAQYGHVNETSAIGSLMYAAELGYAQAQYECGKRIAVRDGLYSTDRDAARYYRKAADQGHLDAIYELARCYEFGRGLNQSDKKAGPLYTKAAKRGHAIAMRQLGLFYENGRYYKQNIWSAQNWFKKAADKDDHLAQYCLGKDLLEQKKYDEAQVYLDKAYLGGVAEAGYCLAQHVKESNEVNYIGYIVGAALLNHVEANFEIGEYYLKKNEIILAKRYLKRAAELGSIQAMIRLGYYYRDQRNHVEAFQNFGSAAFYKSAQGYFEVARCYQYGWGVIKNGAEAIKFFKLAYEADYFNACCHLAECYQSDELGVKDTTESLKYLKKHVEVDVECDDCELRLASTYKSFAVDELSDDERFMKAKNHFENVIRRMEPSRALKLLHSEYLEHCFATQDKSYEFYQSVIDFCKEILESEDFCLPIQQIGFSQRDYFVEYLTLYIGASLGIEGQLLLYNDYVINLVSLSRITIAQKCLFADFYFRMSVDSDHKVGAKLYAIIAKDISVEFNVRYAAAAILMRNGHDDMLDNATRVQLGLADGDPNDQNVHDPEIHAALLRCIANLKSDDLLAGFTYANAMQELRYFSDKDSDLSLVQKQILKLVANVVDNCSSSIYSDSNMVIGQIFLRIWLRIKNHESKDEIAHLLIENLLSVYLAPNNFLCHTGKVMRMVQALQPYFDDIVIPLPTSLRIRGQIKDFFEKECAELAKKIANDQALKEAYETAGSSWNVYCEGVRARAIERIGQVCLDYIDARDGRLFDIYLENL
jgi:TPR repeat protein